MTKPFDDYFSENAIINYLSKQRAKYAKKRSKDVIMSNISKKDKYNKIIKSQGRNNILYSITPPRRLWVRPSKKKRYLNGQNGQKINSIDKNKNAIFSTIKKHIESKKKYKYLDELNKFINNVHKSINSIFFSFQAPVIRPEPKKKGSPICRPISIFTLKDNMINCLTNKYLIHFFDDLFYEHSFAFRAGRFINGEQKVINHHDAFKLIIDYLNNNNDKKIFVAECDMQKFYDTVNHDLVIKRFRELCYSKKLKNEKCDKRAKRIFCRYLKCYSFYKNVSLLGQDHFDKYKIPSGMYQWINKEELRKYYKKDKHLLGVGIPQGGALSGLIANIVLDYADKEVLKLNDENLLYIRYCDDMIMMHTNREKCNLAMETYNDSLTKLQLFPHPVKNIEYGSEFWEGKSKGPYEWSDNNISWIGFVGYEINRKGEIRVRKRSLNKEMNKQQELINSIISAISNNNLKVSKGTIIESAYNRLNGMAVGRVELWNYTDYKNDMCWVNGFQLLNKNKYSSLQLKSLDRSRNRYMNKLFKFLDKVDDSQIIKKDNTRNKDRESIFYGKPFSYFYQALKNSNTGETNAT